MSESPQRTRKKRTVRAPSLAPADMSAADDRQPLHIRVRENIRREVREGKLVDADGRLMTEAELVKHFGVSRITIRSAMRPLVEEGMFARERGRGTFLQSNKPENWIGRLLGFSETIRDAGFEPGARILHKGMTKAHDFDVYDALGERAVWELKRLRLADATPIAIEHAFYPPDIGLELADRDLVSILMYRVFEDELGLVIGQASQSITACLADEAHAELLGIRAGAPLLGIERLTTAADGRPLELLRSVYLPDYYRLVINLTRRP